MKARVAIFELCNHAPEPGGPGVPRRHIPLSQEYPSFPATRGRIDAYLAITELRVSVKMWFTVSLEARDMFARSEEVDVIGKPDGRLIEAVVSAGPVTFPAAGTYRFELIANGKPVTARSVRIGTNLT